MVILKTYCAASIVKIMLGMCPEGIESKRQLLAGQSLESKVWQGKNCQVQTSSLPMHFQTKQSKAYCLRHGSFYVNRRL